MSVFYTGFTSHYRRDENNYLKARKRKHIRETIKDNPRLQMTPNIQVVSLNKENQH